VLELNASDERGINVVRDSIKTFAENSTPLLCLGNNNNGSANSSPKIKIIILDEADALTRDA
jgi:DNA polymerase III delta prime subunit